MCSVRMVAGGAVRAAMMVTRWMDLLQQPTAEKKPHDAMTRQASEMRMVPTERAMFEPTTRAFVCAANSEAGFGETTAGVWSARTTGSFGDGKKATTTVSDDRFNDDGFEQVRRSIYLSSTFSAAQM